MGQSARMGHACHFGKQGLQMNTRWREIAVTCWDERIDGYHFDSEMFAELIVRECVRIDIENPDAAPGVEIAKYFGIQNESNI